LPQPVVAIATANKKDLRKPAALAEFRMR